jgi:DNA-directed RNA polymerase subunit beta'
VITDDNGRERERHKVPYGALLLAQDGKPVRAGGAGDLGRADPSDHHRVRGYREVRERRGGRDGAKQIDEVTGLSTLVVIDAKRRGPTTKGCGRRSS